MAEQPAVPHVLFHITEAPYQKRYTTSKTYPSQENANEVIMKEWNEYKEYELEECQLLRNRSGCLKFYMRNMEGSMAGRGPEWELVEVGSGSLREGLLDNVYDEDNEDQYSFGGYHNGFNVSYAL
ncbi:hypothetical protein HK098_006295 [Nowakowskiella sp. JEL0407]|nr:hypothetical protein HK098_006295 [Nowakowskiella sp. JEL0407]